jgi:hypothetical protein
MALSGAHCRATRRGRTGLDAEDAPLMNPPGGSRHLPSEQRPVMVKPSLRLPSRGSHLSSAIDEGDRNPYPTGTESDVFGLALAVDIGER